MRMAVAQRNQAKARIASVPAPVHGLVYSAAVAKSDPLGAEVLENWFPTQRGIRIRGGLSHSATLAAAVTAFMEYYTGSTSTLFAADASQLYQVSTFTGATLSPIILGLSGGSWGAQQIGTVGGDYLEAFNGVDHGMIYDGTEWNPLVDVTVNEIGYTGLTGTWVVGTTLTEASSGSSATILAVTPTKLKLGTISGGPFTSGATITAGSATATSTTGSSVASTTTIAGVASSALCAPWIFGNRLFAIEAGTLNSWYWPVDSIGGTLQKFSLAGVFQKGGELIFGCAWSSDAGAADGIRYFDHCVFMSSEGEIATYRGSYTAVDPATAGDWILTGRYDVAEPLGRKCHIKAGGDVAIATVAGVVPMSAITSKDPAALAMSAVSHPIDPLWKQIYTSGATVEFVKWTENATGLITSPGNSMMLSVNLQTGAWAKQTGWDASCATVFSGQAYIGRNDGKILACDTTGSDDGVPFTAKYCHSFMDLGSAAQYKITNMARGTFFAGSAFIAKPGISVDYTVSFDAAPLQSSSDLSAYLSWDTVGSLWDTALWWGPNIINPTITEVTKWQAVSATGYTMAPTWQITSGGITKLNIELTRTDLSVEAGGSVV